MAQVSRRKALGVGGAAAAAATGMAVLPMAGDVVGRQPAEPRTAGAEGGIAGTGFGRSAELPGRLRQIYQTETRRAGGRWQAMVSVAGRDGVHHLAVAEDPDRVVQGYSVNKVAVALAVLDKIDRGQLSLGQTVTLAADQVLFNDGGIYHLHGAWGDRLTLGNVMSALLLLSDNTAVTLCGQVCSGTEVNAIVRAKGFPRTQVTPGPRGRMVLGRTTARETHTLLARLAAGQLLSPQSTEWLLTVMRWMSGYHDGIRHAMSSDERLRIATKYGALVDGRNEAGILFDEGGAPLLTYSFFARLRGHDRNFGHTHPLVQAHARMGRQFLDATKGLRVVAPGVRRQPKITFTTGE